MKNTNLSTPCHRRGSIMVVTMTVVMIVGFLLISSADNVMSVRSQTFVGLAKQKAAYAAESVAADEEDRLVGEAAQNNLIGLESMSNYGVEWMNDCAVRWKIEPVRTKGYASGNIWSVNPPSDVSKYSTMSTFSNGDGTYATNYDYYVYRIVTEAWALSDPNWQLPVPPYTGTAAQEAVMPWSNPSLAIANVQSSRVIQLRLNSLFKYCIFYAASGPTGDIEFHPGAEMTIPGAVHSNGAIYFGGNGSATAAPPANGGPVYIGGALSGLGSPTTVVGVDGIFRLRKSLDLFNGIVNPLSVPLNSSLNGGMGSPYELNDHELNVANDGSYCNDSRNGPGLTATFSSYVRDGITLGATTVATLSNIPALAGRPFEATQEAPSNASVSLINGAGLMTDPTNWTIHGGPGQTYPAAVPLLYKNPGAADYTLDTYTWFIDPPTYLLPTSTQFTAMPGGSTILSQPVPATNMPLYGPTPGDITLMVPVAGVGGFDSNEMWGPYYSDALLGKGDGTFGIVLRERATQRTDLWGGAGAMEPASNLSYNNLLNAYGLPTDGTAPSPNWIIYSNGGKGTYTPLEYTESKIGSPATIPMLVVEAAKPSGQVPSLVNSWVISGTSVLANLKVGRAYYALPSSGDVNRELMPRLDYYVTFPDAGNYLPFVLGKCADSISKSTDPGHDKVYVGLTPLGTPPDYLGSAASGVVWAVPLTSGAAAWSAIPTSYVASVLNGAGTLNGTYPVHAGTEYVIHVWMADDVAILNQIAFMEGSVSGSGTMPDSASTSAGIPSNTSIPTATYPTLTTLNPYQAMVLYMKSQYAALVGAAGSPPTPLDITNDVAGIAPTSANLNYTGGYFGYSTVAPASLNSLTQLSAYESNFMNRREADWMRQCVITKDTSAAVVPSSGTPVPSYNYYRQNDGHSGVNTGVGPYQGYTCNTITLNMDQTQSFINTSYVSGATTTFNGLLYCCRTHRGTYPTGFNPILNPQWNSANWANNWGGWPSNNTTLGATPASWWEPTLGSSTNRVNNRVPADGPDYVFHESVRLNQASTIDWGGRTAGVPSRTQGLTVVSPNTLYLQGDVNIIPDPVFSNTAPANMTAIFTAPIPSPMTAAYMHGQLARSNSGYGGPYSSLTETQLSTNVKYPPMAVFADQITVLSNAWSDAATTWTNDNPSSQTWYNTSMILNNVPSDLSNVAAEGSGGMHNVVRYLEDWSGVWYHFRGSLVCMNAARYTDGNTLNTPSEVNSPLGAAYSPPSRDLRFNTDLLTQSGQPPFAPFGVQVIRTVSTINDGGQ